MPRQPLLPTHQKAEVKFGIAQLERMPQITERVGQCVMLWSQVEFQMAMLLSVIMKADSEPTVAVFLALKNLSHTKRCVDGCGRNGIDTRENKIVWFVRS
jgi:hypothetical protein